MSRDAIAESYGRHVLCFLRNYQTGHEFQSGRIILYSHQQCVNNQFFKSLPAFDIAPIFYFSHSDWFVVISHSSFNVHFCVG